jgi:hypothetical protein
MVCHDGATAPKFYLAGTLFSAITGGTGVGQATIEFTDGAGKTNTMITAAQSAIGNFHWDQPVTFPVTVKATRCPAILPMSSPVNPTGAAGSNSAGCNSCHNAQNQIHLP